MNFYFHNNVDFGQRRLIIVNLKSGKQPVFNEDKTIAVIFNGEIYNYNDVKKYLEKRQHNFKTNTDTEVLVHLYEEHGYTLSEYIEGMFALVIYDKKNKTLTISRDRFGKKPLYYYLDNNLLAIASEMKVLLQIPEIMKNVHVDRNSLMKYLIYSYVPSPNTILDNIKKLEMSTTLLFKIDDWEIIHKHHYWDLPKENKKLSDLNEEEILKKMDYLIKKAIEKRITPDISLGVLLSGGVDSSLICAITKKFKSNVESFTISYPNKKIDESKYARIVADHLGVKSNFFILKDQDALPLFKETLEHQDEPMTDAALIPGIFLCKLTRQKVNVAFSGDAGDELFGGYPKYRAQIFAEIVNKIPFSQQIIQLIINLLKYLPSSRKNVYIKLFKVLRYKFGIRNFIWGSGGFLPEELCKLINIKHVDLNNVFKEALDYENQFKQKDTINKAMYLDFKIQLPDWYVMKPHRQSMATSLDIRAPFLDKDLVEFMFTIPSKYKVKLNYTKILSKQIASRYVPKEAIYREKKGFRVPLDIWLRTVLRDFVEELLKSQECNKYFNQGYVMQLWKRHLERKEDNSFKILSIVNFIYFMKKLGVMH